PGGNLNITCSAVAFPFPEIVWEREQEDTTRGRADVHLTTTGTNIRSEQLLIIKQNTNFTCHAHNEIGETSRLVRVVVTGPGSAPVLRQLTAGRTRIEVHWEKPHVINRPLTAYALYFTTDPMLPIKSWSQVNVSAPAISHVIHGLNSDTLYTIRVRAHDSMGPGKLSNPVSVRTLPPAIRPFMYWESRSRNISIAQQGRHIALQHSGLYENSEFFCVAENEAGRTVQKIFVLVTGPSQPERIRYHTDGDKIFLQWEEPRITNGPIVDYEVFYIPIVDADKPDQEWTVQRSGGPSERTLTLRPLREQTEYMVKVRALNRNGPGLFSLPFTSKTWLAPRLPTVHTVPSDHVENRPSQEGFDVLCEAEGVPKPKILWWWENRPIEDGSGGFRIVDIASLDEQKFKAINERGLSEAQVKMIILGPGSPPDRISVRPVLDGFSVHWEPPLIPNGDVLGYSIYWSSNPDADLAEWSQKNFDSDARDATITDQQEQTPYVIRLQAFGSDGPGLISPSYEVVTGLKHIPLNVSIRILSPSVRPEEKEGGTLVDPDQPISFECVTDGRPQPVVSWSWIPFGNTSIGSSHLTLKPDPSTFHRFISAPAEARTLTSRTLICEARNDQGQVRDGHIFRVLRPGGPPVELGSLVIDAKQPKLTLPRGELQPQTPYYVRVAAENPHGRGQLSDISRFVTLSGAPIDVPTDLSVHVEPDNTIRASWSPPSQPNGELKHYTVYFISEDKALEMPDADEKYQRWPNVQVPAKGGDIGEVILDRDTHVILPNTVYRIRVTASNELSEGPATPKTFFRTGSGEVAPSLKLEPPDNPASVKPLEDYSVICVGTGIPAPDVWWTLGTEVNRQQGGSQLRLSKLSKDIVAVCHAQNNAGVEELTLNVQVRGPGTPPNEIVAIPLPSQILSIEWAPPDEPNGKLTGYVLHYAEVPDEKTAPADDDWNKVRVGPDANKYQLEALKAKTNYWVRLQAISDRGEGIISDPVKTRTLPLAPKAPDVMPIEIEGPPSESQDFDTQTGVVPPDQPLIHVDTDILKVPAGTDYTVECSANGYPPPKVFWTDVDGNVVSEGSMLRVFDIRQSIDYLCVAENPGGRKETSFRIFVSGPGSAPEMSLSITKPKSILAKWDPPALPNGNITRYIVYYTPLDDQTMDLLVGQVPAKPISEWISAHLLGPAATGPGQKQALLTDFIEPDTGYAVVVQAENQDGPGPYSIQHNIRTMTRSRSSPPTHVSVEPINQTSVEVHWRLEVKNGEESPIGYEIYFVPAEKEIEEDELLSIPSWTRVNVVDPSKNSHMIWNMFEPDSEYVFKIRALYQSGPDLIIKIRCIAKTLPDGDAPFLVVSAGGRGTEGLSVIRLLPGSDYTVFCRASGRPQPAVRWIRGGEIPIDPSTVKEDETGTKWSLSLQNFTEPSTFNCVARNPLGAANWTIQLEMLQDLRPDWLSKIVRPEVHNGQLLLHFPDSLPDSLRRPNQWTLRYSDDPSKEKILWSVLESEDRPLTSIPIKSPADPMQPGLTYHLVIENPTEGVRSPVLTLLVPKAPSELRVGSNINDEMVVDFRPAITSSPVEQYLVKASDKDVSATVAPESTIQAISIPGDQPVTGIRVPDLPRDSEFYFQAVAILSDGQELASTPVIIRTPAKEIRCDCSHACRLLETDSVEVRIECYCPVGWLLTSDGRTCMQIEPTTGPALEISPTFELLPEQALEGKVPLISQVTPLKPLIEVTASSPLPTDEYGNLIIADLEDHIPPHILPTDAVGREIRPVVYFNGTKLRMNEDGNYLDPLGRIVTRDEEQRALGPDGQYGEPIPTDDSLRPLFEVVDEEGVHWPNNINNGTNEKFSGDNKGHVLGPNNRPIPTDITGQFLGPDSSPLPTNFYGQFLMSRKEDSVVPTDSLGYPIYQVVYPDGQPLPTLMSGQFINPERGVEFMKDDQGIPLDTQGKHLKQDEKGNFVFQPIIDRYPDKDLPEKITKEASIEQSTLPTDWTTKLTPISGRPGKVVDGHGQPLSTSSDGLLLGPDGSTDAEGQFVLSWGQEREELPSEPTAPISEIGPDGLPQADTERQQIPPAFPESKDQPSLESEMKCNLREAVLDILIAFNSELIQPYGEHLRRAMTELLSHLDLAADIARVGILHFGKSVIIPVSLGGYHEINQMLDQIDRMQSASSALGVPDVSTVYHAAIQQFSSFGRNQNIPKILLVFSSGEDIFSDTTARDLLASHDIFIILVGPSSYDSEIAEESSEHVLINRWELLDGNRLADYLEAACARKALKLPKSRTKFVTGKDTKEISTIPPIIFPQIVPSSVDHCLALQARSSIVLMVETSQESSSLHSELRQILLQFIHEYVKEKNPQIGILYYGDTVDIGVDVDQHKYNELEVSVKEMHFIGGVSNPLLAIRTAQKLLVKLGTDTIKLVIHIHRNKLKHEHESEVNKIVKSENIALLDLFYELLGPDGQLRPTDSGGNYLDLEGYPLPLDELGRPIDSEGRLLPTDSQGHFLLHSTRPDQVLATRIPQSSPLPTDELGHVSKDREPEVGRGEMALPTDQTGKFIHPVIDSNTGEPLLTDQFGRYLDINGELLPMDDFGRPLDPINGRLLPTNEFGQYIYTAPTLTSRVSPMPEIGPYQSPIPGKAKFPIDEFSAERIPVVDKFGDNNEPLPLDSWSRPLDVDGLTPLPTNRHGQFVYTPAEITPTISGPISPSPIPTDQWGIPITPDEGESTIQLLPTDGTGKEIFPVISAQNGLLLPRNSEGRYLGARNELIPIDDFGRPLDSLGRVLPINEFGQFIYTETYKDITPTLNYAEDMDGQKQPIWLTPDSGQRRKNGSSDGHCFIENFIELLLIFDTSANVKILDYRMMKESIKTHLVESNESFDTSPNRSLFASKNIILIEGFLLDHFDLRPNHGVRVGLLKYGDSVEVPVALGDYDSEAELLARIGETRRLKGEPNLPLALREAAGEFQLSGAGDALRIVLVWKSGNSSDSDVTLIQAAADTLRQQYGAKILAITAAGHYSNGDLALTGAEELIFAFDGWREAKPKRLAEVADKICEFMVPTSIMPSWPSFRPKSTLPPKITSYPRDCRRVDYPLDFIIVLDAANFDRSQFSKILESLATLVDESFNLSPDVVRVGLIVYSDKVAVPVALGNYDDKIELLYKMSASPLFSDPPAIALRGLEAAGQQFRLHSRPKASRVLLMVTNGKHRGNAAPLGQELRENLLVKIYSVVIGASSEQLASLQRVVGGPKLAAERMLQLDSVDELSDPTATTASNNSHNGGRFPLCAWLCCSSSCCSASETEDGVGDKRMGEMEEEEFEQQRQQNSIAAASSNFEVTGASGNNIASRKHSPGMDSLQHTKTPCRKVSPTVSFGPQTITAASSIKGSPILSSRTTKRSTVDVLHRFAQDLCAVSSSGRRAKFHKFSLGEERWKWNSLDGNTCEPRTSKSLPISGRPSSAHHTQHNHNYQHLNNLLPGRDLVCSPTPIAEDGPISWQPGFAEVLGMYKLK
uniref:Uncharacterized protein n=1 Tax=Meloidogyne javanica TaxID=6303 RepID=A0A915MVF1_MELJA